MPDLSILRTPSPYHILTFGTLLGTEFYQSFVAGIVSYNAIPRSTFSTLQQKITPVYFAIQTALPALLALTYPGVLGGPSSFTGTLSPETRLSVLTPLATIFITGLSNLVYFGPETTRIIKQRNHQETKDGKKSWDPAPHSKQMEKLNKSFTILHSVSALVNMVGLGATIWYGIVLAERIQPLR